MRIGVISDTHGLLRPEALEALRGSDCIIHAGDVGDLAILDALRKLAPVAVVRGNIDTSALLPETALLELEGRMIWVLHNRNDLDLDPASAGIHLVVSGHSHKPLCETVKGVIYLNPGSAGPRRFRLPVTIARVDTAREPWAIEFVDLAGYHSET
jgi:putative phosphoesterase